MGRKIPGKKHRGVKDPHKQRAKRLYELKLKINDPPKNIEDQDIPKSLQRVIKLKNDAKNKSLIQKKKKKKTKKLISIGQQDIKPLNPKARPDKVVPIFNQKPNESLHHFWARVNKQTHDFIRETEFETKFKVDVIRNVKTGQIEGIEKKPKDSLSEFEKLASKHKNINKKKKAGEGDVKLTKYQKRKQKLLKKKEKRILNDAIDFDTLEDKVEFGEVVHAPPELKVLPRNSNKTLDKVKHKNLLLNSILQGKSSQNENKNIINKTGKRKNLPVGERRQLEKEQKDVVAAYRLLKAKKSGESTNSL